MTTWVTISVDQMIHIELDDSIPDTTIAVQHALMAAAESFEQMLGEYLNGNPDYDGILAVEEFFDDRPKKYIKDGD